MRSLARSDEEGAVVIVNTCAVTTEAERQARQAIRRARRENPEARIVVTGCAAQIDPERFAAMPEVDRVVGNREKLERATWKERATHEPIEVGDIMSVRETSSHLLSGFETHTRAFVQVQNGCDHRCTFCIIPFGRGPSRSVAPRDVIAQVAELSQNGVGEVVLSGVDLTAWGDDLAGTPSLGRLVTEVLEHVPELPRLRLSSVDAVELDAELWQAFANQPRLMPHLHLSLQSGDDLILKRMKRRHSNADARRVVERARLLVPDMIFGADFIAGFPTETEEMFEQSLRLVTELDLVYLHVFPYSPRPGTPASRLPQLPSSVRKERAARLREAGEQNQRRFLETKIGSVEEILMESDDTGRTRDFARVRVKEGATAGSFVRVVPTELEGDRLVGHRADGSERNAALAMA